MLAGARAEEGRGQTYQRFMTLPEKLLQFWHTTVMCSAPLSCELNAAQLLVVRLLFDAQRRRTVCAACEEEEHICGLCALWKRSCSTRSFVARRGRWDGGGAEVELCASCGLAKQGYFGLQQYRHTASAFDCRVVFTVAGSERTDERDVCTVQEQCRGRCYV
jgi:hypothetical protein